jgi:hypothetical protein
MKSKLCISFLSLSFVCLLIFWGCRKSDSSKTDTPEASDNTLVKASTNCAPPDYGDSLIYSKWKGPNNDYFVPCKNNTTGGRFISWPQGLVIDSASGTINVTQSETGQRYKVGFIKNGTQDTCISEIVLAGITYLDSVYVLERNDTLARPYYNANPLTPPVCDNSDDTDYPGNGNGKGQGDNQCDFDVNVPPGQQKANDQGVRVRTISGIINLKKTLADGAFGPHPQNGATKMVTVYYRLNDNSAKAQQKIKVQLVYYTHLSDVPMSLISEITTKRRNFLNYMVSNKPRPPFLVIATYAN